MIEQGSYLSILARAPAVDVKSFAEVLIPMLDDIEVLQNRTGLVMLPMRDTVRGELFYAGEALLAEAHVRIRGAEGYAACLGRDLQQALAIALIDAAYTASTARSEIEAFVAAQAAAQAEADAALRLAVARTRVQMETF